MHSETSSKVSPMCAILALRKHIRINIPRLQLHPLFPIPPSILPLHPGPEDQSDDYTSPRRTSRGNEGGNILWCVLHPKSAGRKDAGEIAETDKDPGRGGARVLGEVVVVVPRMHEAGGDVSAGGEEEACEVGYFGVFQHVDGRKDDKSDHADRECENDVVCAFSEVVRRPGNCDKSNKADAVRSHSPKIGLDCRVPETLYDLYGESA